MFRYIMAAFLAVSTTYGHSNLIGIYGLEVKIGEKNFVDIFEVKKVTDGKILGSFSVPGVFKAPFEGAIVEGRITGRFTAKERGSQFEVILKANKSSDGCRLNGNLSTKSQVFGVFVGKKRGCHE